MGGSSGYLGIDPPGSIVTNGIIDVAIDKALSGSGENRRLEPWWVRRWRFAGMGKLKHAPRGMIDCLSVSDELSTVSSKSSRRDRAFPVAG